jgi:hypothetical protein
MGFHLAGYHEHVPCPVTDKFTTLAYSVATLPSGDVNVEEYGGRSRQTLAREQMTENARRKTVTVAVGGRQCEMLRSCVFKERTGQSM